MTYTKRREKEKTYLYSIGKRAIDVALSSIALVILSPAILSVALAVKMTSKGPIFADMPKRVGEAGKLFFMYKFRSMPENAYYILQNDPQYKELYEKYKAQGYKLSTEEDPRITSVGKFIRKTSLDELPQFLNVIKGEMSIVGPRAYFPDELRNQAEHYPKSKKLIRKAITVKPGITGPWQVGGRNAISFPKRIKMDAEYAKKQSLLYDMHIILKTPVAILLQKGTL